MMFSLPSPRSEGSDFMMTDANSDTLAGGTGGKQSLVKKI